MKCLWQQIPSTTITELYCQSVGFDGVVLDTEHGCFSDESLYECIRTIHLWEKASFVRVTYLDKKLIRMVLDAGANGLIFSTVESYPQAEEIKEYCLYPPEGLRGQGLVRENLWGKIPFRQRTPILIAQIETATGVRNVPDIMLAYDFNYYMVGPYDLSASLGSVGNFDTDEYREAIRKIEMVIGKEKMGYHIVSDIQRQLHLYKDCGFLALSMDTLMILESISKLEELL